MTNKLMFDIDSAVIIDENPDSQFATARIDAFSTGITRHDTTCDVETLKKTTASIYEKPIVFEYKKEWEDFGTHTQNPIIAGFVVPNSATYFERNDGSGRTTLRVIAKIWKRYAPKFMDVFSNTFNKKRKVSVEMEVLDSEKTENGILNLKNWAYSAVCVLGEFVTEASPDAQIEMVSFAKRENIEYTNTYNKEFSNRYVDQDFRIPDRVKENAKKALELNSKHNLSSPVFLSTARYFINNENITPEKVKQLGKFIQRTGNWNTDESDIPTKDFVNFLACGGKDAHEWLSKLSIEMDEEDDKHRVFYQKNSAEVVIDKHGKELNLKDELKKEVAVEEEVIEKKEKMAEEEPKTEEKEEKLNPEDANKEAGEKKAEKMSLDAYLDIVALLDLLKEETESNGELEAEFAKPEEERNYAVVMGKMFTKMCKMSKDVAEMSSKIMTADKAMAAYMAENEELKKFKSDVEKGQFDYEVESTLKEIVNSVKLPNEEMSILREESKNFSLKTIDAWRNLAKAKAFTFGVKSSNEDDHIVKYGIPFAGKSEIKSDSLWN